MRRISRDAWLLIGLSTLLVILTVLAVVSQTRDLRSPALSAESTQPDGALALRLWLEALGYEVAAEPQSQFRLPDQATIGLVLQPAIVPTDQELADIDAWVRQGGVLILAGNTSATMRIAEQFDFEPSFNPGPSTGLAAQSPLLVSPPQRDEVQASYRSAWLSQQDEFVVLFARGGSPVVVATVVDDGLLIVSASALPFSNAGLREPGNSQLVLNAISASGGPGLVWFDQWHLGLQAQPAKTISGPLDWLRQTPAGRALLYSLVVILGALALSGRAFGRPLTLPERRYRRPPIEYISAVANLSRRAGHRQAVLTDYRYRLKRSLGYRYRLDPRLADHEFIQRLATVDASVDTAALSSLLARLNHPEPSEAQLIQMATEASQWIKES
jgi:hypothetical protein